MADVIRGLIDEAMGRKVIPMHMPLDTPITLTERATAALDSEGGEASEVSTGCSSTEQLTKQPLNKKTTQKKAKPEDAFKSKKLPENATPNDLLDCDQLLREWWAVKKGVRSESVYNRVCRTLRGMTPEDRAKALESACSGGWANVFTPHQTPTAKQTYYGNKPLDQLGEELDALPNLFS